MTLPTPEPSIETSITKKAGCFKGDGKTCDAVEAPITDVKFCEMISDCMWSGRRSMESGYSHRVNLSTLTSKMEGGLPVDR